MERPDLSKLAKDYNGFHNSLKGYGYSRLERGVIYTGLGLGMFAPVAATRYLVFPMTDSMLADIGYWAASVGVNALSSGVVKGFPLVYTGGAGAGVGLLGAFSLKKLRERRRERKKNEEEKLKMMLRD